VARGVAQGAPRTTAATRHQRALSLGIGGERGLELLLGDIGHTRHADGSAFTWL